MGDSVSHPIRGPLEAARLSLKINRFEVLGVIAMALAISCWALWLKLQLDSSGFARACYRSFLANPDESNACLASLRAWSEIASGDAGRAMGAALLTPFVIGIALGVPLVGREIEQRTAATAWALAGSRRRWLLGRVVPALALALILGASIAVTSEMLSVTRALGGSTYYDAIFAGIPVMGHIILGLGLGVVIGAVTGRTLPAFLIAALIGLLAVSMAVGLQSSTQPFSSGNFGDGNQFGDLLDPRFDYDFIAPDGRVLTRAEALATVPAGTADVSRWLAGAYEVDDLGVADWITAEVQFRETAAALLVGTLFLLAAFPIVERRRPG
jgi:hypothetical protein